MFHPESADMEQRDSLDRSSSEIPAPASAGPAIAPNALPPNGGSGLPVTGQQIPPLPFSATTANEHYPVVESVLRSDVQLPCFQGICNRLT